VTAIISLIRYYFSFYLYYYFIATSNITSSTISIELFKRLDILFIEQFIKIIIRLPSILVIYISRAFAKLYIELL
jgi:hypothetical protein